jgi:hypothetical protein
MSLFGNVASGIGSVIDPFGGGGGGSNVSYTPFSQIQSNLYPMAQPSGSGQAYSNSVASSLGNLAGTAPAYTETNGQYSNNLQESALGGGYQATAPSVVPSQNTGTGSFQAMAPAPATVTAPPFSQNVNQIPLDIPYFTAQQNQQNQQQYNTLTSGLNTLGQGYQQGLNQLTLAGASEQQQLQLQQNNALGQNTEAMANAGLTGSSVESSQRALTQNTYNMATTALAEQVGAAKAQVLTQGSQAMATYLAQPQYTNDNNILLQGMAAQSNVQLSGEANATQQQIASSAQSSAETTAGITAGTSALGALALLALL